MPCRQGAQMFGLVAEEKIMAKELICRGQGWRLHSSLPIPGLGVRANLDKQFVKQTPKLFSLEQMHPTKRDESSKVKIVMNADSAMVLINDYHNFDSKGNASITQENYTAPDGTVHPSMVMAVYADVDIDVGVHILVDYGEKFHLEDPNYASGDDMDNRDAFQVRELEKKHCLPQKENKEKDIVADGKEIDIVADEAWSEPEPEEAEPGEGNKRVRRHSDVSFAVVQAARIRRRNANAEAVQNAEVIELGDDDDGDDDQDDQSQPADEDNEEDVDEEDDEENSKTSSDEDANNSNGDEDYTQEATEYLEQHAQKKQKIDDEPVSQAKQSKNKRKRNQKIPKKTKPRKGKATEYLDAPKFLTAYILFCNDKRPSLGHVKPNQVLIELGKMWKASTDDEKLVYEEQSKKTKKEREGWILCYNRVMHTFFCMKHDTDCELTLCHCAE